MIRQTIIQYNSPATDAAGKWLLALLLLCVFPSAPAQDPVWAPDFPVGSTLPVLSAQDQNGQLREFADLAAENGMLFMLSRSFDW